VRFEGDVELRSSNNGGDNELLRLAIPEQPGGVVVRVLRGKTVRVEDYLYEIFRGRGARNLG
jgi:hypothetical protein